VRDEIDDYDADLLEKWFDRGVERSAFSGRLIVEELDDIAPRTPEFWASLAFLLQRKELRSDAGDAWAIAAKHCKESEQLCRVLFAAAHSWWDVHLELGRAGAHTDAWEQARESIERASRLGVRAIEVHQWFVVLYEDVRETDRMFEHLAAALGETEEGRLDWSDFWFASEKICEIDSFDGLLRALVSTERYEEAGQVLDAAFAFGLALR
jgi:hypothetical protein